jgi:MoaA/NifB/PqqE/SkfB family radical SAM enzyme
MTRRCPRDCSYCGASKVSKGEELDWLDWIQVNDILKKMGVDFNLILGNETWLLGMKLERIMKSNQVPYALYTTCPPVLFERYKDYFFTGSIDNLSCGIDYSHSYLLDKQLEQYDDMEMKSAHAWLGLSEVRKEYPHVDCQGTVTLHKQNYWQLPEIVKGLSELGIFVGVNVIHHNKDGKFDFFPEKEFLNDYLFEEVHIKDLKKIFLETTAIPNALIQNKEMLQPNLVRHMIRTDWHCNGDPYGGPTIDSDGSLRCCGYRKGERASQYTIFDLPKRLSGYLQAIFLDAKECPGCFWSYPWMYRYWQNRSDSFGKKVFINHAGLDIPVEQWSKRKVE